MNAGGRKPTMITEYPKSATGFSVFFIHLHTSHLAFFFPCLRASTRQHFGLLHLYVRRPVTSQPTLPWICFLKEKLSGKTLGRIVKIPLSAERVAAARFLRYFNRRRVFVNRNIVS